MNILIIDDEELTLKGLKRALTIEKVGNITACINAIEGENEIYTNSYDIILIDILMPEKRGDIILKEAKAKGITGDFIVMSALNDIPLVVECLKSGAYDYHLKPVNIGLLTSVIDKIKERRQMKDSIELFTSNEKIDKPHAFDEFITDDVNMKKIMKYAEKIAVSDSNVLIFGETGTGKEIFAKVIHLMSRRSNNNFVPVNMAAIPSGLFESALFGHKKGAFTGAVSNHDGYCLAADKGTLFLDEISALDQGCQNKMLRLIENKTFYPVGFSSPISSDFRLITATNKNLYDEAKKGKFAVDLYYRIKESYIYLPPLRERGSDIVKIAKIILTRMNTGNNSDKKFTADALYKLMNYSFPGNFRELRHVVEFAYHNIETDIIGAEAIIFEDYQQNVIDDLSLSEIKKEHIIKVLSIFRTRREAADALGITPRNLYKYLKKYNLEI